MAAEDFDLDAEKYSLIKAIDTEEGLSAFAAEEVRFLYEMVGNQAERLDAEVRHWYEQIHAAARLGPHDQNYLQRLRSGIAAYLSFSGPSIGSLDRRFLEQLDDPAVRRAAFFVMHGVSLPRDIMPQARVLAEFNVVAFRYGVTPKGKPIFRDFSKARDAFFAERFNAFDRASQEREERYASNLAELKSRMDDLGRHAVRRNRAFRRLRRKVADRTLSDIDDIHKVYREQMRLQEPVKYWSDKQKGHVEKARLWLAATVVAGLSVLGAPLIVWKVIREGWLSFPYAPTNLFFGAFGNGWEFLIRNVREVSLILLVSGLTIWALRLCTRVYLSERHLATDAAERQTIVMTYLALLKENAATDAERSIVLQTLFRSSADGIVRDDSGMDPSIAGLIAKMMERPNVGGVR